MDCGEVLFCQIQGRTVCFGGIAQQIGGVKNRHHRPSIPALPLTTKLGHAPLDAKDGLHSGGSREHDHLGINGLQLQVKPGPAGGQLSFFRPSVVGGPAFDRIADVEVMFGVQIHVPQQLIEGTS